MSTHLKNGKLDGSKRRRMINGAGHPARAALSIDLRLRAISEIISASSVEELWVFPPLPNREVASEFIVLVCYDGGEDHRRIVTAHMDAECSDPDGFEVRWIQRLRDHGSAPSRWVSGMPDRLLQRLSDAGVPEIVDVGGDAEAWEAAISRLAGRNGEGSPVLAGMGNTGTAVGNNGNGSGARNGSASAGGNGKVGPTQGASGETRVDTQTRREVGFHTVIESASTGESGHFVTP